jgi:hypothetical protein
MAAKHTRIPTCSPRLRPRCLSIPELIDTVDFKKGPYYAEVGDFSSAGTADLHLFNKLPQGFVKFGVGQDDLYRLVVADSPQLGPGILLYAFEGRYYDGPWDTPERLKKFSGVLKYTLDHGHTGFSLLAMGYASKWDSVDQIPERAVAQGLVSRLGAIDQSDGGKTSRYSLSGAWWRTWGNGTTRANAYVVSYTLNLFSNFTFFLDDPVNGDQFEQADRRVVSGGHVAHTWSTDWLGTSLEHTLGLQVRHDAIPEVGLHKTRERTRLSTVRNDNVAEIEVRSTCIPGLHTTVAFWYLTLDSELLFVGDAGITEPSRPSRRYGVEWTNFYRVTPWLTLDADFAFAAGTTVELPYNLFAG